MSNSRTRRTGNGFELLHNAARVRHKAAKIGTKKNAKETTASYGSFYQGS